MIILQNNFCKESQETRQIICESSEIFVIFMIKKDSLLFITILHPYRPSRRRFNAVFNRGNNMNN